MTQNFHHDLKILSTNVSTLIIRRAYQYVLLFLMDYVTMKTRLLMLKIQL